MKGKSKKALKWIGIMSSVIVSVLLIGAMIYIFVSVKQYDQIFTEGIIIEEISVGGLTRKEAYSMIQDKLEQQLLEKYIEIGNKDKIYKMTLKELETTYDLEAVLEMCFKIGHEGSLVQKYQYAKKGISPPQSFHVKYTPNQKKIEELLAQYAENFFVAPINATIERKNKAFLITPEVNGKELDTEKTTQKVCEAIRQERFNQLVEGVERMVEPTHTVEQLEQIEAPISSFYTSYNNADNNRNINLKVAASKINTILTAGETFSLAEHLEPITAQEGYRPSKVIINGRIEEGIGGGVCQIASTLYNAVLLSNLDVVARQNHSLPVAYVPLGRDATYTSGGIDFRFKNNSEYPVFIEGYCENNRVYVNLFSHESLKPAYDEVKFHSEVIEVIPSPEAKYVEDTELEEGKQIQELPPLEGKKVKLYKLYYKNGEFVKKEVVDTSYYKPRAELIRMGTKGVSPLGKSSEDPREDEQVILNLEQILGLEELFEDIKDDGTS